MAGLTDRAWRLINRNAFTWRWLSNFGPTLAWRRSRPDLPPEGARVLADLRRDGLARTSVDALGFRAGIWEELQSAVAAEESRQAAQIEEARRAPEREGHKSYLIELLGRSPVLDPESVFVRMALDPAVLDIATSYFGMYVRLWQFNVWHNVPTRAAPRNSQLWHRDPEDRQILRIFIYLDDVGPGSGPLSYIPGSHALGRRQIRPPAALEGSTLRTTDDQMERVVPRSDWATATGRKGDVWLVDTRGYHKGGHVAEKDRLAYNAMWVSAACRHRTEYFTRPGTLHRPPDPKLAFAIGQGGGAGSEPSGAGMQGG